MAGGDGNTVDPLREQLLDAAARVFANKGYSGTKVIDIVREAGLSSGAMYGRFESKRDLLTEAVVTRAVRTASEGMGRYNQIADLIAQFMVARQGALSDDEALRLEAYVTARREDEVAAAIVEMRLRQRKAVEPLVKQARSDGTVENDADVESILYFLDTVGLGLLLQRAAGIAPPNHARWDDFVRALLRSLSADAPGRRREQD